jgi:hypothetical protein
MSVLTNISEVRKSIYSTKGFWIVRNFLPQNDLKAIQDCWTSDIAFDFSDFIANREVKVGSPPYLYNRPSPDDFAYCTHIWNDPVDELLHSYAYQAQMIRNQVEGNPLYDGLHETTGKALQYRVCRTTSSGKVVNKHADFFDEFRKDPTGNHAFDPSRVQLTLMLSNFGKDYSQGGFKLWLNEHAPSLFGEDIPSQAGDLIVWRYSIPHEVSDVVVHNETLGFLRVIFPQFDIG